jgi:hypothetical protein
MRHSGGPRISSRISFRERALSLDAYEGMDQAEKRDARARSGIRNRAPATIGVPAENFVRELKASHGVDARGQLHAARRHLHDVRAAGCVEHVRAVEDARKGLTVPAVADEAEAAGWRELARNAAHAAAAASEREIKGHACHIHAGDHEVRTANSLGLLSLERWRGLAEGGNRRTTDLEKMADCASPFPRTAGQQKSPAENRGAFV